MKNFGARYALLADVFFVFHLIGTNSAYFKRKFDFFFGFWAEGLGVNAQNSKLLIVRMLL